MEQTDLSKHDVKKLQRKLQAGEPLTPDERAAVEAAAGETPKPSRWARNQTVLAATLGVSRMTIHAWRQQGAPPPRPNGEYEIAAWRKWIVENGRNEAPTSKPDSRRDSAAKAKLKATARRLQLQNEKLETEIGILKRKFLPADEVERSVTELVVGARRVGEQMPAALAPQLAGLDVIAMEKRLRDWWDEFCEALHRGEAEPKEE